MEETRACPVKIGERILRIDAMESALSNTSSPCRSAPGDPKNEKSLLFFTVNYTGGGLDGDQVWEKHRQNHDCVHNKLRHNLDPPIILIIPFYINRGCFVAFKTC